MIEINNISKNFGHIEVLKDVSVTFQAGQCVAIIGPNGCGKTTLIKSVLGMVLPDKGEILFGGSNIRNNVEYRNEIGYMPQIGRYPENRTIGQIVDMIKSLRNFKGKLDDDLINAFHLETILYKKMHTLSGGTTQKVSALLAFLFDPNVLILDEPTAGLDPLASEILKEKIVAEKEKGKLILITSHLLSELDDLVTQILFMQDGKVVFHQSVEELKISSGEERISKAIAKVLKGQTK
ncbi:MAG: ABC transporter ATP-binding protein [Saprospiraceae bacterium]